MVLLFFMEQNLTKPRDLGFINLCILCVITLFSYLYQSADILLNFVSILTVFNILFLRFDYTSPFIGLSIPWLLVIFFSYTPISSFHADLLEQTKIAISIPLVVGLIFFTSKKQGTFNFNFENYRDGESVFKKIFNLSIIIFSLEIIYSGYIPLFETIMGGSRTIYEFGIPSVHGFYLALSNSLSLIALIFYLNTRKRYYLFVIGCCYLVLFLCLSRINIGLLLVQHFIIFSFLRHKFSLIFIFALLVLFFWAFQLLGELRSGKISDLINPNPGYENLPEAIYWIYGYSFFNMLNLNVIFATDSTYMFSGISILHYLPSAFTEDIVLPYYLPLSNLFISSYLQLLLIDIGLVGAGILTFLLFYLSKLAYDDVFASRDVFSLARYSVIYFILLFSFYDNYFFTLPFITQVLFISIIQKLMKPKNHQLP